MNRYILTIIIVFSSILFMGSEANACVNELPVPGISDPSIRYVPVGSTVSFHGYDYSYDPDNGEPYGEGNGITEWWWDVCDEYWNGIEIGLSGSTTSYPFTEPGHYYVELWVKGDDGEDDWTPDESGVWVEIYVVEVDYVEYNDPDNGYVTCPNPLYIHKGTTVNFKAIKNPSEASWPSRKPIWGGTSGASGTGETANVTFNTLSSNYVPPGDPDYITVTCTCGNTVTINAIVYEFEGTFTPADNFSKRSTMYYGLEEEVGLGFNTDPWSVPCNCIGGLTWSKSDPSQPGTIGNIDSYYGTANYDAGASDGGVWLKLTIDSGPSKGQYYTCHKNVVKPSGTRMTRATGNVKHNYGTASAGIVLYYWLDPKNVSFSNLTFGEDSCPATGSTGIYVTAPPGNHPQNTFGSILGGNITTGCRVQGTDGAWTERYPWGSGGTFTWSIPTQYIDDTATRNTFGSNQTHNPTIQANGYTTMSKGGQSGSANVNDQTSGW